MLSNEGLLPAVTAALEERRHVIVGCVDAPARGSLETADAEAEALRPCDTVQRVSDGCVRVAVVDPVDGRAGGRFDAFVARLAAPPAPAYREILVSCCELRRDETAEALLARLDAQAERRRH